MRVYFSTVIRTAQPQLGGAAFALEWPTKRIVARTAIVPDDPLLDDPNPRGNTRGGRGIVFDAGNVVVASYHSLLFFDRELRPQRRITHHLFAGIHELAEVGDGSAWVAATAIDAALRVDLASGDILEQRWPREMPGLRAALGVEPLDIDKSADNRGRFLAPGHTTAPGHLHLNAVAVHEGRLLALLHTPGVIADLDADRVLVRDRALVRAHDLLVRADGTAIVADTAGGTVRTYDLRAGRLERTFDLHDHAWIRAHVRRADLAYKARRLASRVGLRAEPPARPLFVRGLERSGSRLLVGISPAAIVELDAESGRFVDAYAHSHDVHHAIHGLRVEPPAASSPARTGT